MAGSSRSAEEFRPLLQRGQACAHCRRRKIRCDGVRPKCGPCTRGRRLEDCEYTDNFTRTRAQRLEEDISRVQSRIDQLENTAQASGESVVLHHPYQPQDDWWTLPEPPAGLVKILIDTFLPSALDWGFFLDPAAFRNSALLPQPIGHHTRPSPPLLLAVYLLGIALSSSPSIKAHENTFLSRVLTALPASLAGIHPQKALHALQTEVLLATYFFANERVVEGRYHTATAASLVVPISVQNSRGRRLEPVELDAYWTTVILDKSWAVALGAHPNIPDSEDMMRMRWPGQQNVFFLEPSTVSQFLDGTEDYTPVPSTKTVLAKAAFLWERAHKLVPEWTAGNSWSLTPDGRVVNSITILNYCTGMTQQQASSFFATFDILDSRIHELQSVTGVVDEHDNEARLFLGRTIAYAATIQLHRTFASENNNADSNRRCVDAAKGILSLVPEAGEFYGARSMAFVNPISSTIWVSACEIAIEELSAIRAARSGWVPPDDEETALIGLLDRAVEIMRRKFHVDGAWASMRRHLAKIESEYGRLGLFQ